MDAPKSIIQVSNLGVDVKRVVPTLEDEAWCNAWEVKTTSLECIHRSYSSQDIEIPITCIGAGPEEDSCESEGVATDNEEVAELV